jgi:uncharacterized membrane protein YkoI
MTPKACLMKVGGIALALALVVAWQGLALAGKDSDERFNDRRESYACSVKVAEPEPKDLSSLAKVKADAAIGAVLTAHPGTVVTGLKLENEHGCLVYSVHLNNGQEVIVDAGKGTVIHSQPAGSDDRDSDREARENDD